ncbi:MAG TPA: tetratricopeptide repeat protein [Pyrinomonadaceae bacterium]|nr:tetratricopeptide repeat protein [Pyrinomonadaceae bacterium]
MNTEVPKKEPRRTVWLRYVAIGVLATAVLVGLKLIVEHTSWGKENQLWVFGKLQGSLSSIDLDNPVVVLDISTLPGGKRGEPTPRKQLQEIIGALADLEPRPRAIAVDVNFSPRGVSYSAPADDEQFFDFCLHITRARKVPMFLAVAETKSAPPEAWLGNEKYKDLAVVAAADKNDTSHIPLWVKSSRSGEKLKSLNYALALEYRKHLPRANPWIEWAVDTHADDEDDSIQHEKPIDDETKLTYQDTLVNYSKLDQIRLAAEAAGADVTAAAIKQSTRYSDKLIILGDLSQADHVPVPGRQIDEPGSLVLASATYTLIKEPLFEFKWWVRLGLDFLIAGLIILAMANIRRRSPDRSWTGKQALFVYVAVIVVVIAGWKLVTWAGVLWLDFLLVALALLFHPKTEHLVDHVLAKLTKVLAKLRKGRKPVVKTACVILGLMAMSGELGAQEGLLLPAPCAHKVAAVGLRLTTQKPKSKKEKVKTCYVRDNFDAPWQALTESSVKRQYNAGQHITCDADCSVTLYFCGTYTEEAVNKQLPDWFPILHAYRAPPPGNDTKPHNLLRQARAFSPADPQSSEERRLLGRRFGGLSSIAGAISGGSAGITGPPVTRPSPDPKDKGAKSPEREPEPAGKVPSATPNGNETSSSLDNLRKFLESLDKGNSARKKGEFAVAREHYLAAQKVRPRDYRGIQGVGNVFADEKNWNAAELAYREALTLERLNSELNSSLAFVMLESMIASGDYTRATEVEKLISLASSGRPYDQRIYDLYEQLIEMADTGLAQAEVFFRRALTFVPRSSKANLRLARVLYRLDRSDEALDYVRVAEEYAYDEQLLAVARIYEAHGNNKDAERVLRTALKAMPNDPSLLYRLGSVLVKREDFGSALSVLQTTVDLDPKAFAPALTYGIARFGKDDLNGAESSFDQASRNVGENSDGLQRLAYWFAILGDVYSLRDSVIDAIRVYEKSIIHAENSEVRDRLLKMKQKRDSKRNR